MADGFKIADAWVDIHARGQDRVGRQVRDSVRSDSQFESAGQDAGNQFGEGFSRSAGGRLRDARGQFAAEGRSVGQEYSRGFQRGTDEDGLFERLGVSIGRKLSGGILGSLSGLGGALSSTLKFSVLGAGIASLGAAAASSLPPVVALVGELLPLGGLLAALPGVALTGAAAFTVWKLATGGLGEAMKAALSGNPEALAAALSKLSEGGRAFIREFEQVIPELRTFKAAAQDAFLSQISGRLAEWVAAAANLKPAIAALASEFGGLVRSALDFATAPDSIGKFNTILGNTRGLFAAIREALQPLLTGFTDLAVVGSNWLAGFAPGLRDVLTTFGQWMSKVAASGQAMQWMNKALGVLKQLGAIVKDVWQIFDGIFDAMRTAGVGALGVLGQILDGVNKWVNSAKGQAVLVDIFKALREVGQAFLPVITALASGIGALAPTIASLATTIGPILAGAINAVVPALKALGPGLLAVFGALGQAVQALAPALVPLAQAISGVMIAVSPLLPLIGRLAAQVITTLAPALPPLAAAFVSVLQALAPLVPVIAQVALIVAQQLTVAIQQIAPYLPGLVQAFGQLLIALTPLIPSIIQLALALTPLIPVVTDMIRLLADLANAVMPVLTTAINANAWATRLLGEAISVVWGFIRDEIQKKIEEIKTIINWFSTLPETIGGWLGSVRNRAIEIWNSITTAISTATSSISSGISGFTSTVTANWNAAWTTVGNFLSTTWSNIQGAITNATNNVRSTISGALSNVQSIWNSAWNSVTSFVGNAWNNIRNAVSSGVNSMLGTVRAIPGQVLNALGNLGNLLYGSGQALMQGLINGLWSMFNSVWNTAVDILNRIRSLFPSSPAKEGPFSGRGWVLYSGMSIGQGLADGMAASKGAVASAAESVVGAAAAPTGVTPAGFSSGAVPTSTGGQGRSLHIGSLVLQLQGIVDLRQPGQAARQFLVEVREGLRQLETEYA